MTEHRLYSDENNNLTLIKTWPDRPMAKEIMAEINKIAEEVMGEKVHYVRFWDDEEGTKTYFDFGSWSVFVVVEPSVFVLCAKGDGE